MQLEEILLHMYEIKRGNAEPMAKYLAEGGEVTPRVRAALVQHLRKPAKRARRTLKQQHREALIVAMYYAHRANGLTQAGAFREIIKGEPNLTPETIRNYIRNNE